jgi:hypothetical protein
MCGRCVGEPYRGVTALFNGDLQSLIDFNDRKDWLVVSGNVILHIGETALGDDENCLIRDCDTGYFRLLTSEERLGLESTGSELSRPVRPPK